MILSIGIRRGVGNPQFRFGTGGRKVMAIFYAMIIIVECRRKLVCPGLRCLTFSNEPNGFVWKSEPILGISTGYRAGPSSESDIFVSVLMPDRDLNRVLYMITLTTNKTNYDRLP